MAITMTERAVERVAEIKRKRQTPDYVLRLGVKGGGCSGLSYFVDLVEAAGPRDKIFRFDQGVIIAVDRKSYLFLNGTEVDFSEDQMRRGFEFNNPLASRSCSCGESFTI